VNDLLDFREFSPFRGPDGRVWTATKIDGFQVTTKAIRHVFEQYIAGDESEFVLLCSQLKEGLREYLRHNRDAAEPDPVITIEG